MTFFHADTQQSTNCVFVKNNSIVDTLVVVWQTMAAFIQLFIFKFFSFVIHTTCVYVYSVRTYGTRSLALNRI